MGLPSYGLLEAASSIILTLIFKIFREGNLSISLGQKMEIAKKIIPALFCGILFSTQALAEIDEQTYIRIAEGVLAKNRISPDDIIIVSVKPLPANETILQIGYKSKNTNEINIVYAVSDDSVIIGGDLIQNGSQNTTFDEALLLRGKMNIVPSQALNELKKYAIPIIDKANADKDNLYIVISPNSKDFNYIFFKDGYKNLIQKYNLFLIPVNLDDSVLLRTSQLVKDKLSIQDINNIVNLKTAQPLSDNKIDFLKAVKNILIGIKTINGDEINGLEPIYFIRDERINPNYLLAIEEGEKSKVEGEKGDLKK